MDDLQKSIAQAIVNVFETGRILGDYSAVTVLKGDAGHLTYGRSQTTLGSGNLYKLLLSYCQKSNSNVAGQLQTSLPRFLQKDFSLDTDIAVKNLLKQAGAEDVMRAAQDQFFNENFLRPRCAPPMLPVSPNRSAKPSFTTVTFKADGACCSRRCRP